MPSASPRPERRRATSSGLFAERPARRVAAAGIARHEHEALASPISLTRRPKPRMSMIHQDRIACQLGRLQGRDGPVSVNLRNKAAPWGNAGATKAVPFYVARNGAILS